MNNSLITVLARSDSTYSLILPLFHLPHGMQGVCQHGLCSDQHTPDIHLPYDLNCRGNIDFSAWLLDKFLPHCLPLAKACVTGFLQPQEESLISFKAEISLGQHRQLLYPSKEPQHSSRMLRFLFLEQESMPFAQSTGPEGEEAQGRFPSLGTSYSCLHGEPRLISALKVVLLLQVQPQQTQLFRAYKINGFFSSPSQPGSLQLWV